MKKVFAFILFLFIFTVGYSISTQSASAHVDPDDPNHVSFNHFSCESDWGADPSCVLMSVPSFVIQCNPGFTDFCEDFEVIDNICVGAQNLHCIEDDSFEEEIIGYRYDGMSICIPVFAYQLENDPDLEYFDTAIECNSWRIGQEPPEDDIEYVVNRTCGNIPDSTQAQKCRDCMGGSDRDSAATGGKVWTALGCISTKPTDFIAQVLQIAVGLGGGMAFLMLVYGAFLMITSAGNPKGVENARGVITGAISGLLIIIFSVVILNFIGVQVLQIPGF